MEQVIRTIRDRLAYLTDHLHISEQTFVIILAVLVGTIAGFASIAVTYLIKFFHGLFFEQASDMFAFLGQYSIILIPAIGGLLVGPLVFFGAKEAKGHGVPEVMVSVALRGGRIRPRVALVKAIASSICIGSGGSSGREGPIVQIGSSIGSSIGQLFKMSDERVKSLVAAGAAGGISATFNAPIAGVMFAMEIIMGQFATGIFSLVVIGSVTAAVISRIFMGDNPAFALVTAYSLKNHWELFLYVILGILAGMHSVIYIKVLTKFEDFFEGIKSIPEYIMPAIGGLILGLLAVFYPEVLGTGHEVVDKALHGEFTLGILVILIFGKLLATSLTLGSGGSGGTLMPSLYMGAMLGGAFGVVVNLVFPGMVAPSGAYALVGMAAVFTGANRAPITAIMLLFEMTNDYHIILPLMIACVISTLVSAGIHRESIDTIKLVRRGINLIAGRKHDVMESILVKDALEHNVETVSIHLTVTEVAEILRKSRYHGFPVIDDNENLFGMITFQDLRTAIQQGKENEEIKNIATKQILTAFPHDTLNSILKKLAMRGIGSIPVVDPKNNKKVVGIITRSDIIDAYDRAATLKHDISQPAM